MAEAELMEAKAAKLRAEQALMLAEVEVEEAEEAAEEEGGGGGGGGGGGRGGGEEGRWHRCSAAVCTTLKSHCALLRRKSRARAAFSHGIKLAAPLVRTTTTTTTAEQSRQEGGCGRARSAPPPSPGRIGAPAAGWDVGESQADNQVPADRPRSMRRNEPRGRQHALLAMRLVP